MTPTRWVRPATAAWLATVLLVGWTTPAAPGGQGAPPRPGTPIQTSAVATSDIAAQLTYSSNITSRQSVSVVPKTSGRLEHLNVDVGSAVKAGDDLADLETGSLDAVVQQAEANVASADARLSTVLEGARPETVEAANASVEAARQARVAGDRAPRGHGHGPGSPRSGPGAA